MTLGRRPTIPDHHTVTRRPRGWAPAILLLVAALAACDPAPVVTPSPTASDAAVAPDPSVSAGPPPAPGHELYGFLPYWEMDAGIVDHLAGTPLSTIGLFSVTHANDGSLRTGAAGYRAITGDVGRQIVEQAHAHDTRVELVYTSFGLGRNRKLFGNQVLQDAVIASLVRQVGASRAGRRQRGRRGARPAARRGVQRVPLAPAGGARRRRSRRPGVRRDVGQHARRGHGGSREPGRRGPDLHDGVRLSDRRVRARRDLAAGPPRRRRQGPAVVARPVRGGGRAAREADPRPAAVRRDLAGRRPGDRRAVHRPGRVVDPAQPPRPAAQRAGRPATGPGRVGRGLCPGLRRQPGAAADGLTAGLADGLSARARPGRPRPPAPISSASAVPATRAPATASPAHGPPRRRARLGRRLAPRRDRRRPRAR